jgi:uncharacterized membrane-anchored protein YitT (DUF2179 family)
MAKETNYLKSFYWKDYVTITIGLIIFAVGFNGFIIPNQIVAGGLGGVSVLLKTAFGIPVSITYLVVNTILMILAWFILGKNYVVKSLYGVAGITVLMGVAEQLITGPIIHADPLMASIVGAFCCGIGLGLVYSMNASTGGTDIIGAMITKYKYISMGRGLLYIDFFIVCSSFLLFHSIEKIIYGLVVISVMYYTADMVIKRGETIGSIYHFLTEIRRNCFAHQYRASSRMYRARGNGMVFQTTTKSTYRACPQNRVHVYFPACEKHRRKCLHLAMQCCWRLWKRI